MSSTKRCTKCGETKSLDEFHRNRSKPLGRHSYCRSCQREYNRTWREANQDRQREHNRRRRARKRAATLEEFALADVYAWWDEIGAYTCFWCGIPFTEDDRIHVDHVWPLSRGGHHAVRNLAPACERCNLAKHASLPHEFAERAYGEWLASTSG